VPPPWTIAACRARAAACDHPRAGDGGLRPALGELASAGKFMAQDRRTPCLISVKLGTEGNLARRTEDTDEPPSPCRRYRDRAYLCR
jgi:hypothetical protein